MTDFSKPAGLFVRYVQFLLNIQEGNCFRALPAIFLLAISCSSPPGPRDRSSEKEMLLFAGYPFGNPDFLAPARPLLLAGKGEELYRLAQRNEERLKHYLDQEAARQRKSFCEHCDTVCAERRSGQLSAQMREREKAQMKHLRIRLDGLEARLQAGEGNLAEFKRHRALLETMAEERLLMLHEYWLASVSQCEGIPRQIESKRWFLPYYTAYFRLVQTLPAELRDRL